jgi:hypothetical protein
MIRHKNQNNGMFMSKVSTFKEIAKVPKKESQQYIKQSLLSPLNLLILRLETWRGNHGAREVDSMHTKLNWLEIKVCAYSDPTLDLLQLFWKLNDT